jgi:hypothetical protein
VVQDCYDRSVIEEAIGDGLLSISRLAAEHMGQIPMGDEQHRHALGIVFIVRKAVQYGSEIIDVMRYPGSLL